MPVTSRADSSTGSPSAVDRAVAAIRSAIVSGDHPAGSMLSENELAAALGVSRTPVRAALLRLQAEGWVTIYPKRGALVSSLSVEEAHHAADARQALQVLGVQRASPQELAALEGQLEENLRRQERALAHGPFDEYVDLAIALHRAFVEAGGNPLLVDFYDRLRDRQAMLLLRSAPAVTARAADVVAEHRQLVGLAAAGDVEGFAALLRTHADETYGRVLSAR